MKGKVKEEKRKLKEKRNERKIWNKAKKTTDQ